MMRSELAIPLGGAVIAAMFLACGSGGAQRQATLVVPVPAPDSLPTALRTRDPSEPPLDYILVAFEDTVSAESRAAILAGIQGVVEGGLDLSANLPRSYIVRVPPAADRAELAEVTRRLRELPQVFAAGMWPAGTQQPSVQAARRGRSSS